MTEPAWRYLPLARRRGGVAGRLHFARDRGAGAGAAGLCGVSLARASPWDAAAVAAALLARRAQTCIVCLRLADESWNPAWERGTRAGTEHAGRTGRAPGKERTERKERG